MNIITTRRTPFDTSDVEEPIVIDETTTTRKVFLGKLNAVKTDTGETVSGELVHQRKNVKDEWEPVESIDLGRLKGGEGVRFRLDSAQLKRLYDGLTALYQVGQAGIGHGLKKYAVVDPDEILRMPDDDRRGLIKAMIEGRHGAEVWQALLDNDPDLGTRLALARVLFDRTQDLREFELSMSIDKDEAYWQNFFQQRTWIFGFGLDYRFCRILQREAHVGAEDLDGSNAVIGDFLLGIGRFTALVEIKKPDTPLLAADKNRGQSWRLSRDLVDAVSQILAQKEEWIEQRRRGRPQFDSDGNEIHEDTCDPKVILIIGHRDQFTGSDRDRRIKERTFESFRRDSRNIDILTYDEVYERAKHLLDFEAHRSPSVETRVESDDDLPF